MRSELKRLSDIRKPRVERFLPCGTYPGLTLISNFWHITIQRMGFPRKNQASRCPLSLTWYPCCEVELRKTTSQRLREPCPKGESPRGLRCCPTFSLTAKPRAKKGRRSRIIPPALRGFFPFCSSFPQHWDCGFRLWVLVLFDTRR